MFLNLLNPEISLGKNWSPTQPAHFMIWSTEKYVIHSKRWTFLAAYKSKHYILGPVLVLTCIFEKPHFASLQAERLITGYSVKHTELTNKANCITADA